MNLRPHAVGTSRLSITPDRSTPITPNRAKYLIFARQILDTVLDGNKTSETVQKASRTRDSGHRQIDVHSIQTRRDGRAQPSPGNTGAAPQLDHADAGSEDVRMSWDYVVVGGRDDGHAAGTGTLAGVGRPRGRGRLIRRVSDGLRAGS